MAAGMNVPDLQGRDCDGGTYPAADPAVPSVWGDREPGPRYLSEVREPDDRTLSDLALELVNGPRAEMYSPPEVSLRGIGQAWAGVLQLSEPIAPARVAVMLAAMKCVRAGHEPADDSLVDAVGYLEIARRLR